MFARRRGWRLVAAGAVAACALTAVVAREPILRSMGRMLVRVDPVQRADAIVVAVGAGGAGILEAADLVHDGIASRVVVFADPMELPDREFQRRGVPYQDNADLSLRQLRALGVPQSELMPRPVEGTEDESTVLADWCIAQRVHSIVVVGTSDHTRRLRRVFRRSMKNTNTMVAVRGSRYSDFDPDRWWITRDGARVGIFEFQKLLLDIIRHPMS